MFRVLNLWVVLLGLMAQGVAFANTADVRAVTLPLKTQSTEDLEKKSEAKAGATISSTSMLEPLVKPRYKISKRSIRSEIRRLARQHKVDAALIEAIVLSESNYDPNAISYANARGLMQLLPSTAAMYGVDDPNALYEPKTNLNAGVKHLKYLLKKYKGDYGFAVAAYHAGEGNLKRYGKRSINAKATKQYIKNVIRHYWKLKKHYR